MRIVDVSGIETIKGADGNPQLVVDQRSIEHGANTATLTSALDRTAIQFDSAAIGRQAWWTSDVLDQAAQRTGAIQGALRASQDFDPLEHARINIERGDRAVCVGGRRTVRRVIDIGAGRGRVRIAESGSDAAED